MKISSTLLQVGTMCLAVLLLLAARGDALPQATTAIALPLPDQAAQALLSDGTGDHLPGKAVELSNQRLMSVIDRLERRVFELEHTTAKPSSDTGTVTLDASPATPAIELDGNAGRISLLL